ncbi:hypothetical protein NQU59_11600 [Acinetobacter colistiniresistens]|uniref:hypothetical protein n=1 Tax=Acinetobacter colistiniresistens TaxID=280145 RepID=UPI00211B790E|nr:hypothetical protein [Acinetobacter colistiniresistens]UUM26345.1 hypothetical protein NQU59_11600 [Acinetobacter colistiniresistens]
MNNNFKLASVVIISCVTHSVYAIEPATKELNIDQYTKCASSTLTTGLIKTAFNQQSDRESQAMVYGGVGMALYAGYLTSPEDALNSYKEHQQKIKQDALKYIQSGSRNEIYKFTVSYLVPRNEKCLPLFKDLASTLAKKDVNWENFKQSEQAKKLTDDVMRSAQEIVTGKK